jgi:cell division septum initiation protein DivIVA
MEGLWETAAAEPRFSVVWRGYDRRQVDERVRALGSYGDESGQNITAQGRFDVVLRGYDRGEVDRYFERFGR